MDKTKIIYATGEEIIVQPERGNPDRATVTMFSQRKESLSHVISFLEREYRGRFIDPVQDASGKWATIGHVNSQAG